MTLGVRTCLWFDGNAAEAVGFYLSLIPGSRIESQFHPAADAPPLVIDFTLGGAPYQAINGGPQFTFNEAVSVSVLCPDQAETDRLWQAFTADGGIEGQCGWLRDRFGLWWQIVPEALPRLLGDPDPEAAARVMQAMLTMTRIDVAALEAARRGPSTA